jgi:hypothetical protein
MVSRPTPVTSVLNQRLQTLTETARLHDRATDLVRSALPGDVAEHCLGAVVTADEVTLYVDSPAWATRLRYLAPSLLRQLTAANIGVRHCRIRVLPPGDRAEPARPPSRQTPITVAATAAVNSAAASTESSDLASALRRLADTLARRQPTA